LVPRALVARATLRFDSFAHALT